MKYLVLLLTILSFTITQCGGSDVGSSFGTERGNTEEEGTGKETSKGYAGDVKKIHFFDGGWYGLYPNYNINLILQVNDQGLIDAVLDTPECKLKSQVDVPSFESLAKTLKDAPLKTPSTSLPTPADVGEKSITVTSKAGDNQKDNEVKTYLARGFPQYTDAFAENIEKSLYELAEKMMEVADCNNLDIQELKITERQYSSKLGGPIKYPGEIQANIKRDFSITLVDGEYLVNGVESQNKPFSGCNRALEDVPLPTNLIEPMHAIEFLISDNICLVQPMGDVGLHMATTHENGIIQRGSAGCWNRARLQNHQTFMEGFREFIAKQPEACWVY